jgi:hypothetical protein
MLYILRAIVILLSEWYLPLAGKKNACHFEDRFGLEEYYNLQTVRWFGENQAK